MEKVICPICGGEFRNHPSLIIHMISCFKTVKRWLRGAK